MIHLAPAVINHTRTIYSGLDFLGEVGGLLDMLRYVVNSLLYLTSLLYGSGLDAYLIRSLFKVDRSRNLDDFSSIMQRKQLNAN